MNKRIGFFDCCVKLSKDDDFEIELDKIVASKDTSLEDVFNCVKNRIEKVSDYLEKKPNEPKKGTGIKWYLKQLLPLTYRTRYMKDGARVFCVWNMWFGRCFNIEEYKIMEEIKA